MEEIWKDIPNYEGFYQISNLGRVKSLDLFVNTRNNNKRKRKGKILKQHNNGHGYLYVVLSKNNKQKRFYVHRLVANVFILNHNNLPEVNHKDENSLNNNVFNLEWCTSKYNANYGKRNEKMKNTKIKLYGKKVARYGNNNSMIDKMYMSEAISFDGVYYANLRKCCLGLQKTAGGFRWRYVDE